MPHSNIIIQSMLSLYVCNNLMKHKLHDFIGTFPTLMDGNQLDPHAERCVVVQGRACPLGTSSVPNGTITTALVMLHLPLGFVSLS